MSSLYLDVKRSPGLEVGRRYAKEVLYAAYAGFQLKSDENLVYPHKTILDISQLIFDHRSVAVNYAI